MRLIFTITHFFLIMVGIGQENETDSLQDLLNTGLSRTEYALINLRLAKHFENIDLQKGKNYAKAALTVSIDSINAEACNQLGRFFFFTSQLDSARYYFEHAKEYMNTPDNEKKHAIVNISLGAVYLRMGDYNQTIKTLTESLQYFEANGDELNAAKCYSNISAAFAELGNFEKAIEYNEKALEVFTREKLRQFQIITLPNLAAQYLSNGDTIKAIEYNLAAEKLALAINNKRSLSIIYNNLGSAYLDMDEEKARDYLEKTFALKNELNLKSGIEVAQGNLGYLHLKNGQYMAALEQYLQVEKQVNGEQLVFAYEHIQKCYEGLQNYKQALLYSEKARMLTDSLQDTENKKIFSEIQTKYETEKKEREIFELEARNLETDNKRIQNQNLFLTSLGILVLSFISVYFFFKRNRRRQEAEREKLLQQLKDQEIRGVDEILEAQENERQRIANDLHDNLGSRVATIKLLIENLSKGKKKEQEKELKHLQYLAKETYQEVRKIAHNYNTGALITKGLIPSMQEIATQISGKNGIDIKVMNINVEHRIKNNIEIQVFRINQELLTNIIKHAEATEITIQFSEDNNELNAIIEDNGKGFDTKKTSYGFGLSNIERRIEKLNGNLVLDSSPGYGTTVILTIPL